MAPLTSEHLNLLVFRYLAESGFQHSAFTFGYEAGIQNSKIDGSMIPPTALITLVQKGLKYIELKAICDSDTNNLDADFSLLKPLELISKSADELWQIVNERKRKLQEDDDKKLVKKYDAKRKARDPRKRLGMGPGEINPAVSSPGALKIARTDAVKLEGHTSE